MRTLDLSDKEPIPNWPKQEIIRMELDKPVRIYWPKQLESPVDVDVDVAKKTTGPRGTNDNLRI